MKLLLLSPGMATDNNNRTWDSNDPPAVTEVTGDSLRVNVCCPAWKQEMFLMFIGPCIIAIVEE